MYFLPLIIWIVIVYAIIRNIPLKHIWIILISILIAFFQWFIVIFYERWVFGWLNSQPKIIAIIGALVYGFMALILAIVIRKYFAYQKKKRAEISNKSDGQTKA